MIASASLPASAWIVWAVIGITGGYMTGRLVPGAAPAWLSLIAGVGAACFGGWLFTAIFGTADTDIYLSLISSALVTAIILWILSTVAKRFGRHGNDD